jgi:hypothetical protein
MSTKRLILLYSLFLCRGFVCGQRDTFQTIELLSGDYIIPWKTAQVLVPSDSAYYSNIMRCLEGFKYAKDSIEFEHQSKICGGFFLSAYLYEEQSCPPTSEDKQQLCITRYLIGETILPDAYDDYRPIKEKYIETKEPPIPSNHADFF